MKESNLKLAQKDIDDALKTVEEMENCISEGNEKNNIIKEKEIKKDLSILKLNKIYPIDKEITNTIKDFDEVYFFEESTKSGGIAEHLSSLLSESGYGGKYVINAVENGFVPAMSTNSALRKYGFLCDNILEIIT